MIQEHDLLTLICLFLPSPFVWKEEVAFRVWINLRKVKRGTVKEAHKCWDRGELLLRQKDFDKARKNFIHGLRYLHFGLELAERGRIDNFTVANDYLRWTPSNPEAIEEYVTHFKPPTQQLTYQLKQYIDKELEEALRSSPTTSTQKGELTGTTTMEYIHSHGLKSLPRLFAIRVEIHPNFPTLFQLWEDPVDSPSESLIVQECQGLILEATEPPHSDTRQCQLLGFPFPKIFPPSDPLAPTFVWEETLRIFPYLEGVHVTLILRDSNWIAFPSPLHANLVSFFWEVWQSKGYQFPPLGVSRVFTFILQTSSLCSQTDCPSPRLVLIAARDKNLGQELSPSSVALEYNWESLPDLRTTHFKNAKSLEDVQQELRKVNPWEDKGCILINSSFTRWKLPAPQYVALRQLETSNELSDTQIRQWLLEIVRCSQVAGSDTFLERYPKWADLFASVQKDFRLFLDAVEKEYEALEKMNDRDFGKQAKGFPGSQILFLMRRETSGKALLATFKIPLTNLSFLLPKTLQWLAKKHK